MPFLFTTCDQCGKDIYYGNAYVSIARNIEQIDYDKRTKEDQVQVIDSEVILLLCAKCGNAFHYDRIKDLIPARAAEKTITDDLLEKAMDALPGNLTHQSVNFRVIAVSFSKNLLIKKGGKDDMQPGIVLEYDKPDKQLFIQAKYKHLATLLAFSSPFEEYEEAESMRQTDHLLGQLTSMQVEEIQAFFEMTVEEMKNRNDVK